MVDQATHILRRVTIEEWQADREQPHASYGEKEIRVAERVQERTGLPYTRCERAAHLLYNISRGRGRPISDDELSARPWDTSDKPDEVLASLTTPPPAVEILQKHGAPPMTVEEREAWEQHEMAAAGAFTQAARDACETSA